MKAGVQPVWVAGDLDSARLQELPEEWQIHRHPEQTRTDFQKVFADLPENVTDILVLGGLGKRTDHQLTNLMIASTFPPELNVVFEHGDELLFRLTPQIPFEADLEMESTLSLLPFPRADGVTTEGLRWNLDQAVMEIGGQLGQSNHVIGPVKVTITSGCLYLWRKALTETL
jgi:thiamine pyrophosphokinase